MTDDLKRLAGAAMERYQALSPMEKFFADEAQQRSFVQGQTGRDPGPSVGAALIRILQSEHAALLAENERLRADAERLDWLEKFHQTGDHYAYGDSGIVLIERTSDGWQIDAEYCDYRGVTVREHDNLRAAIDAAMKEQTA